MSEGHKVSYSCGSCGYALNLALSSRMSYEDLKIMRRGLISFVSVDLSRVTQVDEITCLPISWGPYRPKTKLLCRKCGLHIGYGSADSSVLCGLESPNRSRLSYKKFTLKIQALQPCEKS